MSTEKKASSFGTVVILTPILVLATIGGWNYLMDREAEKNRRQWESQVDREKLDALKEDIRQLHMRQNQSAATPTGRVKTDSMTLTAFNRLRSGMSYAEVCRVLDETGTLTSSTSFEGVPTGEVYEWSQGSKVITCLFQNDKLITKAQAGLR